MINDFENFIFDFGEIIIKDIVQDIILFALFYGYIILAFSIMSLMNLSDTQLTISIMVLSVFNLFVSVLYLKKCL